MNRSKRLSPVLKIAENKELYAARAVAEARRHLQHYEQKLEELEKFRDEYKASLRAKQAGTTTISQLQEHQKILYQLNEGIAALSKQIARQKELNQKDEALWRSAKHRTDALDKLIAKLGSIEQNIQLNRESNEVDERSQRKKQ